MAANIEALKSQLYDAAWDNNPEALLKQEDLVAFNIVPDGNITVLLQVINALQSERLFKPVQHEGGMRWQLREASEAAKYQGLSSEQALLYGLVDEAGSDGIWQKNLKTKSGLHETVLKQIIKYLETRRLISEMKSVQYPARKMYIKSNVQPSDSATGGAWFTDGELDESFIDAICEALYQHIWKKSYYQSSSHRSRKPTQKRKSTTGKSVDEIKAMRSEALEPQVKLEDVPEHKEYVDPYQGAQDRIDALLPLPPSYKSYPTLQDLTRYIDSTKITETALSQAEIQQLLDVLVWDNKIEALTTNPAAITYRALRKSGREMEEGPSNGFTEAPCGKCPVFDICEEGGPVAPSNCVYYQRWLDPDGY